MASSTALSQFVENSLKNPTGDIQDILDLIETVRDMIPSDAFYFSISMACNEH
jgi:hypothetical protein